MSIITLIKLSQHLASQTWLASEPKDTENPINMVDLLHTLQGNDLEFLKMVAGAWGIELIAPDAASALPKLVNAIRDPSLAEEIIGTLPQDAVHAIQGLLENGGMLSWSLFLRRFGELRVMGPARRDRERPDLYPASTTEYLWYRAFIGKSFMNIPPEPQEFAFIPEDLLQYLGTLSIENPRLIGRPASPGERAQIIHVSDSILDQMCTLSAALRMGIDPDNLEIEQDRIPVRILLKLMEMIDLIDTDRHLNPDAARVFLEKHRSAALAHLAKTWMANPVFNELRLLPEIKTEGNWQNNPLAARQVILDMISELPQKSWWSISSFITSVKEQRPDFQRPAGDYDSWFILDKRTGRYLRGFSSWDDVDGALVKFLITGPLHWLGFLDLARPAQDNEPSAFRTSNWTDSLWHGKAPDGLPDETDPVYISSDGRLRLSTHSPRSLRYQIARFCEWEKIGDREFVYRLTPSSLGKARKQDLQPKHLIALLQRHAAGPIPPS
ncbi:MAG: helicase-associated domain-containing protein, partial [Anaerolineaceae bacterium]|nr:helicase-associated domain-containing protein [Anaerolineaceae bacterium]